MPFFKNKIAFHKYMKYARLFQYTNKFIKTIIVTFNNKIQSTFSRSQEINQTISTAESVQICLKNGKL